MKTAIVCPNCAKTQSAEVEPMGPFSSYFHICVCGYMIMESEWNKAEPQIWEGKRTVRQIEVQGQLRTFNF